MCFVTLIYIPHNRKTFKQLPIAKFCHQGWLTRGTIMDDELVVRSMNIDVHSSVKQCEQVANVLRDELDDYRQAINENTAEIETVYEFLGELDVRMNRLQAVVEEIALVVKGKSQARIEPLSRRERIVCQGIYVLGETKPWVCYDDLAKQCGLAKDCLAAVIACLVSKNVPVMKKYDAGKAYVQLSSEFRERQATKNVIRADCLLTYWMRGE